MRILKAGVLYFAIVFGAGFILGPIRIFFLVPRFGVRNAELMEMPVMLAVMIAASRGIVRRLPDPFSMAGRFAAGGLALFLMLGAELSLARILQGVSVREYVAARDPVSGSVYFALLLAFAILPALWRTHEHGS